MFHGVKMNILFYSRNFYPHVGGAEEQAKNLAHELQKNDHNVYILTSQTHSQLKKLEYLFGLAIIRHREALFGNKISGGRLSTIIWMLSLSFHLLLFKKKIDIVHIHLASRQAGLIILLCEIFKIPTILKLANTGEGSDLGHLKQNKIFYGKFFYKLIKKASVFIATTSSMKKELVNEHTLPEDKIRIIPNGVNYKVLSKLNSKKDFNNNIIFVGRLVPSKKPEVLIDAIYNLANIGIECNVNVYGDGKLYHILKSKLKENNLDKYISLLGNIDQKKIITKLQSSNIFVSCSEYEGLSNALLEAMASGCACICSNIPANIDTILGGSNKELPNLNDGEFYEAQNGILFNVGDSIALSNALKFLLTNEDILFDYGQKSQEFIKENYDFDIITNQLENLYFRLMQK